MKPNENKPYSVQDLSDAMRERDYQKGVLEVASRDRKVMQGKLDELQQKENAAEAVLNSLEIKIKEMAKNLK